MIAEVVVDISNDSVDRVYDYLALDNTREGMRVKVPFAGRTVLGYVFRLKKETNVDPKKLKTIKENLDDFSIVKQLVLILIGYCSFLLFSIH